MMQFPGSISILLYELRGHAGEEGILCASTSGLKGEEDVAISAGVLAIATDVSIKEICDNVALNLGELPFWYYSDQDKSYFEFLLN